MVLMNACLMDHILPWLEIVMHIPTVPVHLPHKLQCHVSIMDPKCRFGAPCSKNGNDPRSCAGNMPSQPEMAKSTEGNLPVISSRVACWKLRMRCSTY